MTIKELAEQAGLKCRTDEFYSEFCEGVYGGDLERFAELVAAHEREECAKLCQRFSDRLMSAGECADAIMARSNA